MKLLLSVMVGVVVSVGAQELYFQSGTKKVPLTPVSQKTRLSGAYTFYTTPNHQQVGIGNTILVQLKEGVNIDTFTQNDDSFKVVKKLSNRLYLLQVPHKEETLALSNKLNSYESVEFAHPNFLRKRISR